MTDLRHVIAHPQELMQMIFHVPIHQQAGPAAQPNGQNSRIARIAEAVFGPMEKLFTAMPIKRIGKTLGDATLRFVSQKLVTACIETIRISSFLALLPKRCRDNFPNSFIIPGTTPLTSDLLQRIQEVTTKLCYASRSTIDAATISSAFGTLSTILEPTSFLTAVAIDMAFHAVLNIFQDKINPIEEKGITFLSTIALLMAQNYGSLFSNFSVWKFLLRRPDIVPNDLSDPTVHAPWANFVVNLGGFSVYHHVKDFLTASFQKFLEPPLLLQRVLERT